jgi:hypothetical protein
MSSLAGNGIAGSVLSGEWFGSDMCMDLCVSSVLCVLWYTVIRETTDKSEKRSAWILTLLSATVAIGGCVPVVLEGFRLNWPATIMYADNPRCRSLMHFFLAYLFWDSVYMFRDYRTVGGMLHHTPYFLFMSMSLYFNCPAMFVCFFPLEVSTIFLAMGHIWPEYRYDIIFGITFFFSRIVFHLYLWMKLFETRDQSPFLAYPFALVPWLMHVFWFYKWLVSYFKKNKRASKEKGQENGKDNNHKDANGVPAVDGLKKD